MVPHHRGTLLRLPRHSSAPDPADLAGVRRWVRGVRGRTAVDLFCGAGGLSLGLRDAGFTVLVGADSDELAMETHTANLGASAMSAISPTRPSFSSISTPGAFSPSILSRAESRASRSLGPVSRASGT